MGFLEFAGCALTAYSPALALFLFTISHDPVRIIIMVSSAFFWLVALVISSLFWNAVTFRHVMPICIVFSVCVQEISRFCIYKLMRKGEEGLRGLRVPNTNIDMFKNRHLVPYVAGLGYGVMSGAFSLLNILAALAGPATVGFPNVESGYTPSAAFSYVTAIFTMLFTLLHIFWSIIFFAAMDLGQWFSIGWVAFSHLLVSGLTLLHSEGMYFVSLPITVIVLIISAVLAYRSATNPIATL